MRQRSILRLAALIVVFAAFGAYAQVEAEPPSAPPLPSEQPPAAPSADPHALVRVELEDGQVLRGTLVQLTADAYHLALQGGGMVVIPRSSVRELVHDRGAVKTSTGEIWFADPNRTRYFYSPSAMMLRKGQAYFSQKELFFSSVGYGVTDNFSVLVGTVAPAWLLGASGMNAIVALKGGAPVSDNLHVAGGLEFLVLPGLTFGSRPQPIAAGFLFGSATYGRADRHLTLSVGKPVMAQLGGGSVNSMDLIATLSGNVRIHRHIGLITENWLVMADIANSQVGSAHAFGARFMVESIAADLGFIWVGGIGGNSGFGLLSLVPIPWVDFTWNFSLGGG